MVEPTPEQRQAMAQEAEEFAFQAEDDNQALRELHPHVMEVFGHNGWDDPAMDVYNDLDPRKNP